MGGFWEMSHPPLPYVMVRIKIGVGPIFRFIGGVGGWVVSGIYPTGTHPSLRLWLETRLGLGLSFGL